jgi:hypothetical protein
MYDFMRGEAFLYKVKQFPDRLIQWSTIGKKITFREIFASLGSKYLAKSKNVSTGLRIWKFQNTSFLEHFYFNNLTE